MRDMTRRTMLGGAASLIAVRSAATAPALSAPVKYQSMQGEALLLRPFTGRRVALLLNPARSVDRVAVDRLLSAIDRAWEWYYGFFGRAPTPWNTYAGKATVADVAKTCGAACGNMGSTGIEISPSSMDFLLTEAAQNRYGQSIFYELGRNFWFYGVPLGRMSAFITGFAHVHRFHAMAACSLVGGPFNGYDFQVYRNAMLIELLDIYQGDKTLTWKSTLAADKCPPNRYGWVTADFLGAALFEKIYLDHGEAKYRDFWRRMMTAPRAESPRDSAARFVQVAHAATGADYRGLMKDDSLPLEFVTVALRLYWNDQRNDNFTTATADGEGSAKAAGYVDAGIEGYIYPTQVPGTVPLRLYWSERRGDNFTTASAAGQLKAKAAGYRFVRVEGYVYSEQRPGTVPLQLYWSENRGDYFTTATPKGQGNAKAAGYKYVGIEGYIHPP
jgi:hypothetical protein